LETRLRLDILPQPDDTTCGPTCLQAVYRFYGKDVPLEKVIAQVPHLEGGGTLAVYLACHALRRGMSAIIYTYNLQVFDPTWFRPGVDIRTKLAAQVREKKNPKLRQASEAYTEFLDLGGELRFQELDSALIRKYLKQQKPILTGLSATYLYRQAREYGPKNDHDDIRGEPSGHFVVLCGYDREERTVLVADPYLPNPLAEGQYYEISIDRVRNAILLGVLTYDANLLIIEPEKERKREK
jgi:hypothetical protein